MSEDAKLREQLVQTVRGGQAHLTFDRVVENFPVGRIGVRPDKMPHSAWELLEHLRIAQNDILRFCLGGTQYAGLKWPDDYWPAAPAPSDVGQWHASVQAFRDDLAAFERLLVDSGRDLYQPFEWGDGQTLLREALLIVDHNAYHLGQLWLVRSAVAE